MNKKNDTSKAKDILFNVILLIAILGTISISMLLFYQYQIVNGQQYKTMYNNFKNYVLEDCLEKGYNKTYVMDHVVKSETLRCTNGIESPVLYYYYDDYVKVEKLNDESQT